MKATIQRPIVTYTTESVEIGDLIERAEEGWEVFDAEQRAAALAVENLEVFVDSGDNEARIGFDYMGHHFGTVASYILNGDGSLAYVLTDCANWPKETEELLSPLIEMMAREAW